MTFAWFLHSKTVLRLTENAWFLWGSRTEDLEVNAHWCEWITVLHIVMSFTHLVGVRGENCL